MTFSELCNNIFNQAIRDYHIKDNIETPINNPYEREEIENRLYLKCWIDTVQWHFEDIIRDPHIDPVEALSLKRRIDRSNQDRTDLVEQIDSYFRLKYSDVQILPDARLNTESPAWAVDRLSILALKSITCASRLSAPTPHQSTARSAEPSCRCSSSSNATSLSPSTSSLTTSRLDASI